VVARSPGGDAQRTNARGPAGARRPCPSTAGVGRPAARRRDRS